MKRRKFIQSATLGAGALARDGFSSPVFSAERLNENAENKGPKNPFSSDPVAVIQLTDKIRCSRVGLGTGVRGGNRQCNMTRMPRSEALNIFRVCYDRGIRLFDLADLYGSHELCREALIGKPRESYTLISKIWEHPKSLPESERPPADIVVKRFLKELNTDYLDLVQIHCLTNDKWETTFAHMFEPLERLKEQGLIRGHGVTIHSLAALRLAAVNPWVDAMHVRLNTANTRMDGSLADNVAAVRRAHENGKGVIVMKVLGEGAIREPEGRRESTDYIARLDATDAMVVGFEHPDHITEFLDNLTATLKSMEAEQS